MTLTPEAYCITHPAFVKRAGCIKEQESEFSAALHMRCGWEPTGEDAQARASSVDHGRGRADHADGAVVPQASAR